MGKIFSCLQRSNSDTVSAGSLKSKKVDSSFPVSSECVLVHDDEEETSFLEHSHEMITAAHDRRGCYVRIPPLIGRNSISSTSSDLVRNNNNSSSNIDSKIHSFFEEYKDASEDCMLAEGIERFCLDLGLQPDDFKVLVLAWKFEAEVMCRFSRSEFFKGCKTLNVDSIDGIQKKLPELVAELEDNEAFKRFYKFTFKFGLDHDVGERTLPVETAVALWKLVFTGREPGFLDSWIKFLTYQAHVRGVPRDTWLMFLTFCHCVKPDMSNYDESEAWPSIFDDFVDSFKNLVNQNIM